MVVHRFQRDTTPCVVALDNSVGGVKVSIVAFQAIDPVRFPADALFGYLHKFE